jgi:hypothetical protein
MWFLLFCVRGPGNTVSWRNGLIIIAITLTLLTPRQSAAAFECNDDTWQGTSGLYAIARSVAGTARAKLVAELDYRKLTPADAVLILHPLTTLDEASLTAFVQAGGRVAVLDDFGDSEPFLERFGIRRLPAPAQPLDILRGNPHLAIANPVENRNGTQGSQRHPVAKDIDRVVLNHPTVLQNPGLTAVLELRTADAAFPVAITGVVGTEHPGRLFVMSDPSAVMNLMLRYPGNRNFAQGLVRYLTEDDARAGKGQLYIVANRFEQSGHFGTGLGAIADARRALEQLIAELRQGLPPAMLVLLVAITLFGVARWSYRNAFRPGGSTLPRFLRPVPIAAQAGWPGRAAALMAKTTHPALAVLELRAAFREQLTRLVASDPGINSQALVALIEQRQMLLPERLEALRRYVSELDTIERAVAARRALRLRPASLNRLLQQGLDILEHFSQVERQSREPRPPSDRA